MIRYNPKIVFVYGDTNSTLAAAMVVRKLNIPLIHIEAGTRTGAHDNPEEINRILVDHSSELACASDREALDNLKKEGLGAKGYFTGDVMYDAFCFYKSKANVIAVLDKYKVKSKKYILMTWHRQENTSDIDRMSQILALVESIHRPIICPMHPRTYNKLKEYRLLDRAMNIEGFYIVQPVGYLEMIALLINSGMILTDSGGLSKESYFAGVKCMFMLELNVWSDLESIGWIRKMSRMNKENVEIINDIFHSYGQIDNDNQHNFYGRGNAAEKIIDLMENYLKSMNILGVRNL